MAYKEGTNIFFPKPGKESYLEAKAFRIITSNSFQLKWLERLILHHINEDNNAQAKLSASQYGFRADVSTETTLHGFVRRVKHCLVRKKPAWVSFWILSVPSERSLFHPAEIVFTRKKIMIN